jgi:hypothetical protein
MNFLKFLMLLTLSLWLGGIIFASAVEIPVILAHVHDRLLAGEIVNHSLSKLHWLGMVCGLVFLLASLVRNYLAAADAKLLALPHILIVLMLTATAISQYRILPAIAQLRGAQADPGVAARFQHLHNWSVGLEGAVLFLALLALYSQASDSNPRR